METSSGISRDARANSDARKGRASSLMVTIPSTSGTLARICLTANVLATGLSSQANDSPVAPQFSTSFVTAHVARWAGPYRAPTLFFDRLISTRCRRPRETRCWTHARTIESTDTVVARARLEPATPRLGEGTSLRLTTMPFGCTSPEVRLVRSRRGGFDCAQSAE